MGLFSTQGKKKDVKEFQFFNPRTQRWTLWRDGKLVQTDEYKFSGVEIRGKKSVESEKSKDDNGLDFLDWQ